MSNSQTTNPASLELVKSIIRTQVKHLIDDPSRTTMPLLVRGAPGVGKSQGIKAVAKELGVECIVLSLGTMERCDLGGVPTVCNSQTIWNPPNVLPNDPSKAYILLLDEFTAAPMDVQLNAYFLLLDRTIPNSGYKLPDRCYVCAAGNRDCDKAVTKTISTAAINRLCCVTVDDTNMVEEWVRWAVKNDVHPAVTGFIRSHENQLFDMSSSDLSNGFPTPRSWEAVSRQLQNFPEFDQISDESGKTAMETVIAGLVGVGSGGEFVAFRDIQSKFDSCRRWLENDDAEYEIPTEDDQLYACLMSVVWNLWRATRVANPAQYSAWTDSEKDLQKKFVKNYCKFLNKLNDKSFQLVAIKLGALGGGWVSENAASEVLMDVEEFEAFLPQIANNR